MKWLKRYSKCILLAVLVGLLFLIVFFLVFASGDVHYEGEGPAFVYGILRGQIQGAVTEYMIDNNEERPPHQGLYDIFTERMGNITCDVINICALFDSHEYMLRAVPDGCYGEKGESDTNFYSGECDNPTDGEYVWLMDESGTVYSTCIGNLCYANNMDGYQSVWLGKRDSSSGDGWSNIVTLASFLASFIVPFAITLCICVYFKRRPQPLDKPTDNR